MQHMDFIIWMIGFPIGWEIAESIRDARGLKKKRYSDGVEAFSSLIVISIWFGIGIALW